ncbi:MAG: NAD-dependent malic enzyme [Chromatiales bacterium]|nr:NAD-dependent malic enzyme [Chromatiales bacterium]
MADKSLSRGACKEAVEVRKRGYDLIRDPLLNKGTGFSQEERRSLGLEGLLPSQVNDIGHQCKRVFTMLQLEHTDFEKYIALADLQDRNEQLFYRVLCDHLEEFLPIVYTPTVGEATRRFSQIYRRGRGVFITPEHRGRMASVLQSASAERDIQLLVVTDNESILGIGDQGTGGMAISIGKLALYVAGAGIHPRNTLPVCLDVGTNNLALLEDDLYVGWPHPRLRGQEYDSLIEEFVEAVQSVFPHPLVQWEDFRKEKALRILDRYRHSILSFNDDIQGTGAVALAGLYSALRITGGKIAEQRIVIAGAGAAGLGVARQLRSAIVAEGGDPMSIAALDSRGLLVGEKFSDAYKSELAWPFPRAESFGFGARDARDLASVVAGFKPTVLIGTSGQPGEFQEKLIREMAAHTERPIVFPFSNPTDHSEARPADLLRWTEGRALVATGSPFDPVEMDGRRYLIGQGNNVFIFPGLGLGSLLCKAGRVSDSMISAAAHALAHAVSADELRSGLLFPSIRRLREVSRTVADAVMRQAGAEEIGLQFDEDERRRLLDGAIWEPGYRNYIAA